MSSSASSIQQLHHATLPPLTTSLIVGICCILYVVQIIMDIPLSIVTLCPYNVLYLNEYYRIVSSSLFHASIMHIGMNMISTIPLGTIIEKEYGTIRFLFIIVWSILLTSIIYILISWLLWWIVWQNDHDDNSGNSLLFKHSIGFSGVLFHLLVLECNTLSSRGDNNRSIFGFINVPTSIYPWVLLIVLQFIMPNLSLLGHLSGIITGTIQLHGYYTYILPSDNYFKEMDDSYMIRSISSFVATNSNNKILFMRTTSIPISSATTTMMNCNNSSNNSIIQLLYKTKSYIGYVCETIYVIIFGRGRQLNTNIELGGSNSNGRSNNNSSTARLSLSRLVLGNTSNSNNTVKDDDDWDGLPLLTTSVKNDTFPDKTTTTTTNQEANPTSSVDSTMV